MNTIKIFCPNSTESGIVIPLYEYNNPKVRKDAYQETWLRKGMQGDLVWWVKLNVGDEPFLGYEVLHVGSCALSG